MVLIRKNGLWRVYVTRWVGLGLWGRCVSYVRENCVSYARQQIWYHMHAKTAFYMHAKHVRIIYSPFLRINTTSFRFLFDVLFIRIFMCQMDHIYASLLSFSDLDSILSLCVEKSSVNILTNISLLKKENLVWKKMKVCKWWHNINFWVKYSYNISMFWFLRDNEGEFDTGGCFLYF